MNYLRPAGPDVASFPVAPERHLVIVHTPISQELSDWLEVKQRIGARAPDIEVRIATNGARNSVTRRWQVRRPSLVFSVCPLFDYKPKGGTVYAGRPIDKLEQIERLREKGLPVPLAARLSGDTFLDPGKWGRFVVVKPVYGMGGRDVRLLHTDDVSARYAELTLDGTREMLVQPYIEHSENGYPTAYRVLTMFGRALYAGRNHWGAPRLPLEEIASDPKAVIASKDSSFGRIRMVWNDPEIVALAEQAHAAFPERPVLGVDIIRNLRSGKLLVMEVNPVGFTWHFSSRLAKTTFPAEYVRDIYAQFSALDRVAELLIEKTRKEAK